MNVANLRISFAIYRRLVGARIRAQWQYRTSLAIDSAAAFVLVLIDFVVVIALFRHFDSLAGWSFQEVALIYSVTGVAFALCDMVVGHIENLSDMVRSGQFDTMLVRPANTLLQVVASDFALRRIGKLAQSMCIAIYALIALDIQWTVLKVAFMLIAILSGAAIFVAIFIVTSSVQFVVAGAGEIANGFTYGGNQFASYPVSIYHGWLRRLFAYAVPLGFVAYFPMQYVLGRTDDPRWVQLVGPGVASLACAASFWVWNRAVRRYRSTGS